VRLLETIKKRYKKLTIKLKHLDTQEKGGGIECLLFAGAQNKKND
jgi:hypothetical protein